MIRIRESVIEGAVVDYAGEKGFAGLKLKIIGHSGYPDRMFLGPHGHIFFIEFKATNAKPRALQRRTIYGLKRLGFSAYVCDNIELGKRIIDLEFAQLSENSGFQNTST